MTTNDQNSTIAVCLPDVTGPNAARTVSYAHYIHEILHHAGLCYTAIDVEALPAELQNIRILVTVGEAHWEDDTKSALRAWVEAGGSWLSIGGTAGLPDVFGVEYRKPVSATSGWGGHSRTLGEGYLQVADAAHPVLAGLPLPLHFFNGVSVTPLEDTDTKVLAGVLNAHHHETPCASVVERRLGQGRALLLAPDVVGTVVRIQQGVGVTRDGVPAPDGTGSVTDGVLKCDDGAVLDWCFDRQEVPGLPGFNLFLEPIADHWRMVILRAICHLAREAAVPVFLLWLYPRNLPALAHLSHDSDGNTAERALALLDVTARAEVEATWCVLLPGYEPDVIQAIKAGGHELATHYDAMDHPWGEAQFDAQWRALSAQFGEQPCSNKNHYTRWEGDTEFYEWCVRREMKFDGSKGPSKFGEAGFVFGTCHPYFPISPAGEILDVVEVPFLTQDLILFVPPAVAPHFVAAAAGVHGIAHFLFHPSHIQLEGMADSLIMTARTAREAGMEWWTSRRINGWERARRQAKWQSAGAAGPTLRCGEALEGATLLALNLNSAELVVNGVPHAAETSRRWGLDFAAVTLDLQADTDYCLG